MQVQGLLPLVLLLVQNVEVEGAGVRLVIRGKLELLGILGFGGVTSETNASVVRLAEKVQTRGNLGLMGYFGSGRASEMVDWGIWRVEETLGIEQEIREVALGTLDAE